MIKGVNTFLILMVCTNQGCSTEAVVLPMTTTTVRQTDTTNAATTSQSSDNLKPAPETLLLTWNKASASVTAYKVFYTQTNKTAAGGTLIKTINKATGQELPTSIELPLNSMGEQPGAGQEACFYLVADADGTPSAPSDSACVQF